MNRITWLLKEFGFTYRQLAEILRVSPALTHLFHNQKRKLPVRSQALLDHPLLAPYPIAEEMALLPEPAWEDPDREIRILETEIRRNRLILEKRKVSGQLEAMKERHRRLHVILYHTRALPFTFIGGETLVELWWINLKALARQELESLTIAARRKLETKMVVMDAEIQLLQRWLAEERGSTSPPEEGSSGHG
jgi:hypothetical protein